MKYAVEMGSGVTISISSFIKTGSGIQKLIWGIQTHRQEGGRISLLQESTLRLCVHPSACGSSGGCFTSSSIATLIESNDKS
jgi:hypothetical protein